MTILLTILLAVQMLSAVAMMGLILMRYVLRAEPLASLSRQAVIATYAPTIQRYLTGELPA